MSVKCLTVELNMKDVELFEQVVSLLDNIVRDERIEKNIREEYRKTILDIMLESMKNDE